MSDFSWSQPCCQECWEKMRGDMTPCKVKDPPKETCVYCNRLTDLGIYIRIDPSTAPFPTRIKE